MDDRLQAARRAYDADPSGENEERLDGELRRATGWGLLPPFPALRAPDALLESPGNGFGAWLAFVGSVVADVSEDDYQGSAAILLCYYCTPHEARGPVGLPGDRVAWCVVPYDFGSCSGCDFWQEQYDRPDSAAQREWVEAALRSATMRSWSYAALRAAVERATDPSVTDGSWLATRYDRGLAARLLDAMPIMPAARPEAPGSP